MNKAEINFDHDFADRLLVHRYAKFYRLLLPFLAGLGLMLGVLGLLGILVNPTAAHAAGPPDNPGHCIPVSGQANEGRTNGDHTARHRTASSALSTTRGPIPGLGPCSRYVVYYGPIDEPVLAQLKWFDLVILHPGAGITRSQVAALQAAGVIVLGYLSIGEEPAGQPQTGDGLGPVYYEAQASCAGIPHRRCEQQGVASFYLDEVINATGEPGHDGVPDTVTVWGGYYVDVASPGWQERIKACNLLDPDCNFYGTDYLINTLGANGIFLDTVDTASPWFVYSYTLEAMADFISTLSHWYPNDNYVVLNRGIFFAEPAFMADVVRPHINGIVFENYMTEWDWQRNEGRISPWYPDNRDNWAPRLKAQAALTDGYTIFALDYFSPTQQISMTTQISETLGQGWLDYISSPLLDTIRWEVWPSCQRPVWLPFISTQMGITCDLHNLRTRYRHSTDHFDLFEFVPNPYSR